MNVYSYLKYGKFLSRQELLKKWEDEQHFEVFATEEHFKAEVQAIRKLYSCQDYIGVAHQLDISESAARLRCERMRQLGKIKNNSASTDSANHPFLKGLLAGQNLKCCQDKTIVAVIRDNGKDFIGTNGILHQPPVCPRNQAKLKINQGYELCRTTCIQPDHAEVSAIKKWREEAVDKSPILHVFGAKKVCNECRAFAYANGIKRIAVYPNINHLMEFLK